MTDIILFCKIQNINPGDMEPYIDLGEYNLIIETMLYEEKIVIDPCNAEIPRDGNWIEPYYDSSTLSIIGRN